MAGIWPMRKRAQGVGLGSAGGIPTSSPEQVSDAGEVTSELHVCQHLELRSLLDSLGPWQRAIAFRPMNHNVPLRYEESYNCCGKQAFARQSLLCTYYVSQEYLQEILLPVT